MRKCFFLLILAGFWAVAGAQNRNWDRAMQLRSCSIDVKADMFTAVTFIEMEFYNPGNQEIEGLYNFQLEPGQAITALQLDLNGRYRDGSIEERTKATNAYNTIVGKRIDPALLGMDAYNNYSLRIYPIAARSSRWITMTIEQKLVEKGDHLEYHLPLKVRDTAQTFRVNIRVAADPSPFVKEGIIESQAFSNHPGSSTLQYRASRLVPNRPIRFGIPLKKANNYCTSRQEGENFFALRIFPQFEKNYRAEPKSIAVYWDISGSGRLRNLQREIQFLKSLVSFYDIKEISFNTFNYKLQDSRKFTGDSRQWVSYINSLQYDGATHFGGIDFRAADADAVFIFTDGNNSYGGSMPSGGKQYLYCITSTGNTNAAQIAAMIGESGGLHIDLGQHSMAQAVKMAGTVENILMDIYSARGRAVIEYQEFNPASGSLLVTGNLLGDSDTIIVEYGNNSRIAWQQKIPVSLAGGGCATNAMQRLPVLAAFDGMIRNTDGNEMLIYGRRHRIVTLRTSFIVLERIEDYIQYGIEPPVELVDECARRGYVWRDPLKDLDVQNQISDAARIAAIAAQLDYRLNFTSSMYQVAGVKEKKATAVTGTVEISRQELNALPPVANTISGRIADDRLALEEVVVTDVVATRRSNPSQVVVQQVAGSPVAGSVEQLLAGRIPGVQSFAPVNRNDTIDLIRIRGVNSFAGNNPMFVVDGLPVSGNINDYINVQDIEGIEVLRDASATALYGSRGSNGVVIINTRRGKTSSVYPRNRRENYRLKDMEDVEYLQAIRQVSLPYIYQKYRQLRNTYGHYAGFYLDMAEYFFSVGRRAEAELILSNAAEVTGGNLQIIRAMTGILMKWRSWEEAARLASHLVAEQPGNPMVIHEMAMILSGLGRHQEAVDMLFRGIMHNHGNMDYIYASSRSMLAAELNSIATRHGNKLDLSHIPPALLRNSEVDLRILIESNHPYMFNNIMVSEPGQVICTINGSYTRNGSYFTNEYYLPHREYVLPVAKKGSYKIMVNYHDGSRAIRSQPAMVRLTIFRNFGKPDESIQIENVILDNQSGTIEIAEIKW